MRKEIRPERIQRIYTIDASGDKRTLAFDLEQFVSYDVDSRTLQLTNGWHIVHEDSADRLIRAYQQYFRGDRIDSILRRIMEDFEGPGTNSDDSENLVVDCSSEHTEDVKF